MTPDKIRKLVLPTDYKWQMALGQAGTEKLAEVLRACADVVEAAESVATRLMILRPPFNAHVLNDALARLAEIKP